MPRIKVLEGIAGADFSWAPGDVVEVSEEAAAAWADGHRAVLTDEDGTAAPGQAGPVHLAPYVVDEDGEPLKVIDAVVEAAEPPEGAEADGSWVRWSVTVRRPLKADGSGALDETPGDNALFDPDEHSNREVLAYLETVGEEEALRVFDAEAAGQDRAGIAKHRDQVLQAARDRSGGQQAEAEKAADFSRGGGGEQAPETRSW